MGVSELYTIHLHSISDFLKQKLNSLCGYLRVLMFLSVLGPRPSGPDALLESKQHQ